MNSRPFSNFIRMAALVLPLIALLVTAQLGFASPARDGGKTGVPADKSESPTVPYQLYGDKTNSVGKDMTIFHTTGENGGSTGWRFITDKTSGTVMDARCSAANSDCSGLTVEGGSMGI